MQEGRTIIDYPDVDSFFDDVERGMRDKETPGFYFNRLSDPYCGRGYAFHYVTKSKVVYGFEFAFGFTDSLFKLDVDVTPPFDARSWNTRGEEDSHHLYPLRQVGLKVAALFMQLSFAFHRQ